ncbi:hypothetical protein PLICRDRAFT_28867 [Plicaturopsis crispa FD-325 SS-3]|nr:hypothetical protein PLICRDRAFT_28867 [Plicaturopsis crispa FD-325 SS-3]
MSFPPAQAQAEGLCLRYPENLGLHSSINYEMATKMLLRSHALSQQFPYTWSFIDKPIEGQVALIFLPPSSPFPNDGIRWQEGEQRMSIPAGNNLELEVCETKYGFIPNSSDTNAWRVRRRYRLQKGGHPQLVLVHYTRGPPAPIVPSLLNQPVRQYPLRHVSEPLVFVAGERQGQKVPPSGQPPQPHHPVPPFNAQAMLAQQNSNMEALERRAREQRGRERSGSMGQRPPQARVIEDDDSADEADHISARTLAATRYRRNHELMSEVFQHAAFGEKHTQTPPAPYSIFDKSELEEKTAKLAEEIEVLKARVGRRKTQERVTEDNSMDVSMGSEGIAV